MSTEWRDLVVAATVGTASRPVDLDATPDPVREAAPPGRDHAGSLLDAAVAFALARRAGARPVRATVPAPPPDDPRPVVSPLAAELVRRVLTDRDVDLAALALADLVSAGRRLPGSLVPVALGLGARHTALRPVVVRACGAVGPWLAHRNPAWDWATAVEGVAPARFDLRTWETGSRPERVAQLRALHAADPAAAASLLAEHWPSTAPDEREHLLVVLGPVPPPEAEPLLEATLSDRRTAVRGLAAQLLGRLPGSAYRERAAERAQGLLRLERRGLRRVLVVHPPEPFDAAARRDGMVEAAGSPRALGPAAGPVAARVRQVVAAAPADIWPTLTGLDPHRLVGSPVEDYADECLAGWIEAALRDRDLPLVEAVLDVGRHRQPQLDRRADLVAALPPERRNAVVLAALAEPRLDAVPGVLAAAPRPWDDDVARGVDRWVRRAGQIPPGRELLVVLPLVGRAAPASADRAAALRAAADRAPTGAIWVRAARAAAETIDLRRRLHEELR